MQVPDKSFAFLVDADFVLVKDFASKLQQGDSATLLRYSEKAWQEHSERHAVIIPAFQREPERTENEGGERKCASSLGKIQPDSDCWMYNEYEVPLTQGALKRMLESGSVSGFYEEKVCFQHLNRIYFASILSRTAYYVPPNALPTHYAPPNRYPITVSNPCTLNSPVLPGHQAHCILTKQDLSQPSSFTSCQGLF